VVTGIAQQCIHYNCELSNEYNSNLSSSLAIISHRTTQVIHQLINTIILNWVGAVVCQHMTHSADENSKKGNGFQLKAMA